MGLIRKSLAVGTGGVVKGSSKKQRNAAAALTEQMKLNASMGIKPKAGLRSTEAERKAARAASKVYKQYEAEQRAAAIAAQAPQALPSPTPQPAATATPVDLIKSPDGAHWWDGSAWQAMPADYWWDGYTWRPRN